MEFHMKSIADTIGIISRAEYVNRRYHNKGGDKISKIQKEFTIVQSSSLSFKEFVW